jgi:hypothetical protein
LRRKLRLGKPNHSAGGEELAIQNDNRTAGASPAWLRKP